jgi:uncharacterized protein YbjQ (UPF0145 family)
LSKIECAKCGRHNELDAGQCWKCKTPISEEQRKAAWASAADEDDEIKREEASTQNELLQQAKDTADWSNVPNHLISSLADEIVLTTSYEVAGRKIQNEIEIITAECVYGMNIFRDFFAAVRDIFGGRSAATQTVLRDARRTVLTELKREALTVGADAVIAVDLDYQELSAGNKGGMLMIVASGTAVKLADKA